MSKNCYNCIFYGKCAVENYKCPDWTIFNWLAKPSLNISGFNMNWLKLHKTWYRKFDKSLMVKRHEINDNYLKGKVIGEYLELIENDMRILALEKIGEGNDN